MTMQLMQILTHDSFKLKASDIYSSPSIIADLHVVLQFIVISPDCGSVCVLGLTAAHDGANLSCTPCSS